MAKELKKGNIKGGKTVKKQEIPPQLADKHPTMTREALIETVYEYAEKTNCLNITSKPKLAKLIKLFEAAVISALRDGNLVKFCGSSIKIRTVDARVFNPPRIDDAVLVPAHDNLTWSRYMENNFRKKYILRVVS